MRGNQIVRFLLGVTVATALTITGCNVSVDNVSVDNAPVDDKSQSVNTSQPGENGFFPPIQIKAGGEFVAVESPGYACPTMADVDGDGREDLVVGQFSNGNMQFCKNIATTGGPPEFAKPEWIMTGDERAVVPGVW